MNETQRSENVTTKLQRIAELAKKYRELTSVSHVLDLDWMKEAHRRTRKDGAVGIDGCTAEQYAANLEANLRALCEKLRSGTYRPPPVRRALIPKGGGKMRPIGVPTFEDKIAQRAVVMLLEAIYEPDFHPNSYGFRPGRSAHHALEELQKRPTYWESCWVIEADIQSFFDTIEHSKLRSILDQRIRDGVIRRLIDKWLNAGVMEEAGLVRAAAGTPQGGVLSPLLANVYLDEVLDRWIARDVWRRMKGRIKFVRYADDFVLLFPCEEDARRVMDVLPKRFARFGLTLHPEKTRLLSFDSPGLGRPRAQRERSFDFLGFTHFWVRSRKGRWIVRQRTAKGRLSRSLVRTRERFREIRHWRLKEQHRIVCAMIRGHCNYFGITGNGDALRTYRHVTERLWGRSLARRNRRRFVWQRFKKLLERFPLPHAKAPHSIAPSEPAN
jgi:RNA-directed DNA polymerase